MLAIWRLHISGAVSANRPVVVIAGRVVRLFSPKGYSLRKGLAGGGLVDTVGECEMLRYQL